MAGLVSYEIAFGARGSIWKPAEERDTVKTYVMWRFLGSISIGTLPIKDMLWPVSFDCVSRIGYYVTVYVTYSYLSKIIRSQDICVHILLLQIQSRPYMLRNQNLESNFKTSINMPKILKSKLLQNKDLFRNDFRLFFSIVPFEHYSITWLCILEDCHVFHFLRFRSEYPILFGITENLVYP